MQGTTSNGRDGRPLVAWASVGGMLLYGVVVLALPWLMGSDEQWLGKGQGTALLMVAASMLFVLAFDTWIAAKDRLVRVAAALTVPFAFSVWAQSPLAPEGLTQPCQSRDDFRRPSSGRYLGTKPFLPLLSAPRYPGSRCVIIVQPANEPSYVAGIHILRGAG